LIKKLFTLLLLGSYLFALPVNKNTLLEISRTYGYYQGQKYTLQKIKEKYLSLGHQVDKIQKEFDLSFNNPIRNIDKLFGNAKGWQEVKKKLNREIQQQKLSSFSYEDGVNFIEEVKQRTKGEIESPVLETLLVLNPNYEKNPEQEFYDGFKKKFKSHKSSKAKGVSFSIDIPMSWLSKEAYRPNIVQKFIAQHGHSPDIIMLLVKNIPNGEQVSKKEIKSIINKRDMKLFLPSNAMLKEFGYIELEGLSGYWQQYAVSMQRVTRTISMETLAYTLFYQDKMIQIQCSVGDFENKGLDQKMKKFKPLFENVVNSFVFYSSYK